jgi:predicted dehydrogenase
MAKISWGILSTAKIGVEKVIPAMQQGRFSEVIGIASRNREQARQAAQKLSIPRAYGSYEELLADNDVQAVYIPLPNHLHVEWTIKALEAGKHVLCEKPITMNFKEAEFLQKEVKKFPQLKVMEAFMYRHHPQNAKVKALVDGGAIGDLKSMHSTFAYNNVNPKDIRNQADIGGGGLLDIGCYCISISRFVFGAEPRQVCGYVEFDPQLKIDRLASGILKFEKGIATFTCATQQFNYQRACIFGSRGRIEVEIPFTPSPWKAARIIQQAGEDVTPTDFDPCDQYTIQGDLFSQAILNDTEVPTPPADGIANMKIIDLIFKSAAEGAWIEAT